MSSWVTVPCLLALRDEFNQLNPERDRGADGTIGDSTHTSKSDHTPDEDSDYLRSKDADKTNEVHALDVDSTGPWPRPFASLVMDVIAWERARWLDPDDVCRLEYVIFNRQIYSRSRNFEPVKYTGDDPHTNHAHFSARYLTHAENDTSPWGLTREARLVMEFAEFITSIARSLDDTQQDQPGDVANRKALDKVVRYMTKVALSAVAEVDAAAKGK